MIVLGVLVFIWLALVAIAARLGKKAGEKDWKSFALINCIPFAGALLCMMVYSENVLKNERKSE